MSAHLRELPRCRDCQRYATSELFNTWNASMGYFCSRHAGAALRALLAKEATSGR